MNLLSQTTHVATALEDFQVDPQSNVSLEAQKAAHLAMKLQQRAIELQTSQERRQQAELDRMIQHPSDKATLVEMTDQAFRSHEAERSADQLVHILDMQGVPRFFTPLERTLLKGFQSFGEYLPGVAMPMVKSKMRQETANVVLPAESEVLSEHLQRRREEGVRMNVNFLGEALLGEREAQRRLQSYLAALDMPQTEVISIKISTIYSQISSLGRQHTIEQLCDRLETVFRAAAGKTFVRNDGVAVPKMVYLDMEEYRDMALTAEAFMRALDLPGLENVAAGIALQAYIPDSFPTQRRLNEWARGRVAGGGSPITIRIVKGANMEMERVEASLHGWPQAPFKNKAETDANYKRMLHEGMKSENLQAVKLGVASHNLFDVAYGMVLAMEADALEQVQFEMLEGMANPQRRAVFGLTDNMLLYAPACRKQDFVNAIGYLIRRLDENTGEENYLRHAFKLNVGDENWRMLQASFFESFNHIADLSDAPRRTQDRRQPPSQPPAIDDWRQFVNEPDTDFSLEQNVQWAEEIIARWLPLHDERAVEIPLVVAGQEIFDDRKMRTCSDPSRPKVTAGRYRQASEEDVAAAVQCGKDDEDGWRSLSPDERREILRAAAGEFRRSRADLLGAAMVDGGKTFPESDPEVSEAIDFIELYSLTARDYQTMEGLSAKGKGVVVVVSPWNFPIAIPCGGVAAALAAGNTVILKPASDTVLPAWILCQCFWRAGVSKKTLQFFPCSGGAEGAKLVAHDDVDAVVLTGGTETALQILSARPTTNLLAETGGKNATIVTALSDRDMAVKNVVQSAFGHSGQKCSATSLLILEDEVYDDPAFKETLCDAVESLHVGPAYELHTRVNPLIRPPTGDLKRGLNELADGESWAVLPRQLGDNPMQWSPGVKWGVKPNTYSHGTEFFGPVLGVMRARSLSEAVQFANGTGYGLTSGLESLDDREQSQWQEMIRAGNLYINRGTTGAVVLRQPFGGMGKSVFGPGNKAGGPNYVAQLMNFTDTDLRTPREEIDDEQIVDLLDSLSQHVGDEMSAEDLSDVAAAAASYAVHYREEFAQEHDHFRLIGQDNIRRYLPADVVRVRVHADDTAFEILARILAAKTAGCRVTVSAADIDGRGLLTLLDELTDTWAGAIEFVEESDEELAEIILSRQVDRIRYASPERVAMSARRAAPEVQLYLADAPVLRHGRVELLWYFQEQSLCVNYHRYGNLGRRSLEDRADTL